MKAASAVVGLGVLSLGALGAGLGVTGCGTQPSAAAAPSASAPTASAPLVSPSSGTAATTASPGNDAAKEDNAPASSQAAAPAITKTVVKTVSAAPPAAAASTPAAAQPAAPPAGPEVTDPWAVVSAYYGDIESGDYAQAYALLGNGATTGQSYQQFVDGYSCTGGQIVSENWESGDQVSFDLTATDTCDATTQYYTGTDTVENGTIVGSDLALTG